MLLLKDLFRKRIGFSIALAVFLSPSSLLADDASSSFKIIVTNETPYEGHLVSFFVAGAMATPPQSSSLIYPAIFAPPNYRPTNTEFVEDYSGPGDSVYFYSFYDAHKNPVGIACTFVIHSDHSTLGTNCSGVKVEGITVSDGAGVGVVFDLRSISDLKNKA